MDFTFFQEPVSVFICWGGKHVLLKDSFFSMPAYFLLTAVWSNIVEVAAIILLKKSL